MFEVGERNEETLLFLSDVNDEVAFASVSRLSREDPHLFFLLGESDTIGGICWCCSSGLLASIYRVCFPGGTGIPISLSLFVICQTSRFVHGEAWEDGTSLERGIGTAANQERGERTRQR